MDNFAILGARHIDSVRAFTPEAVTRLSWSRERVRHEQVRSLRRVLAHAQRHSPFHALRLAQIDPEAFQLEDLAAIPSMTKNDVMDAWDQVVTDRGLHLRDVTAHLDALLSGKEKNAYLQDKYYACSDRRILRQARHLFVGLGNLCRHRQHHLPNGGQAGPSEPPTGPRRTAVICAESYVHASRFLFPTMLDPGREARVFPAGRPIP
jgi:phenylacetate-CoA ligase